MNSTDSTGTPTQWGILHPDGTHVPCESEAIALMAAWNHADRKLTRDGVVLSRQGFSITRPVPDAVITQVMPNNYGVPSAMFDRMVLTAGGRPVSAERVFWDEECGGYRIFGHYLRKDGTPGQVSARSRMGLSEVPANVRTVLAPFIHSVFPH